MATLIKTIPAVIDYQHLKGDTWEPGTITCDIGGVVINFTGWTAKLEIRSIVTGEVIKTLTSSPAAGITLSSVGVITLSMTATQTNELNGVYHYDLQMTKPSGSIQTFTTGTITITSDITEN